MKKIVSYEMSNSTIDWLTNAKLTSILLQESIVEQENYWYSSSLKQDR